MKLGYYLCRFPIRSGMTNEMKVALVHDYLNEFGGAERVLAALSEIWPEAPIYTAFCRKNSTAGRAFADKKVIESKYAWLIKNHHLYSPLRFLAPAIWKSFDFSNYDLVIASSSWFITRGFRVGPPNGGQGPKTKVVCYCHTPPRYLYGYQTSLEWQRFWPIKVYGQIVAHFLRMYDFEFAQKTDQFIANSKNVAARIEKFYRRDSKVIYPPVAVEEIMQATKGLKPKDYFLVVSRVVGAKGIEMAIKAANELKVPLKVIGEKAGLRWNDENLDLLKNPYVEFLGRLPDDDLYRYYGECKAFLALAEDEDFGITPVEAMAAGRPVIAYRGGGYLETVVEGETGIFFDEYSVGGVEKAIKQLSNKAIKPEDCRKQAEKFSKERFKREIISFVTETNAGTTRGGNY